MSKYRAQLATNGVAVYTNPYNENLFNVLESMHDGFEDFTDFEYLQIIYSELSDEVDDEQFYDLGYHDDCNDLVNHIMDYCLKFQVNKTLLAINIGKYILVNDERQFNTYEDFHTAITNALKDSTDQDINNEYMYLTMALNEVIEEDLRIKYPEVNDDY